MEKSCFKIEQNFHPVPMQETFIILLFEQILSEQNGQKFDFLSEIQTKSCQQIFLIYQSSRFWKNREKQF